MIMKGCKILVRPLETTVYPFLTVFMQVPLFPALHAYADLLAAVTFADMGNWHSQNLVDFLCYSAPILLQTRSLETYTESREWYIPGGQIVTARTPTDTSEVWDIDP